MHQGARCYRSKRWRHRDQTPIKVEVHFCAHLDFCSLNVPTKYDSIKPLRRTSSTRSDDFYIHQQNKTESLHRKRQSEEADMWRRSYDFEGYGRNYTGKGSSVKERERVLDERIRRLEAELAAEAEEREIQKRIGVRERRPYHKRGAGRDGSQSPIAVEERASQRRVRFADDEDTAERCPPCRSQQPKGHHHYDAHQSSRYRVVYEYRQPKPELRSRGLVPNIEEPTYFGCREERAPPRSSWRHHMPHNEIPVLFQRIIIGRDRKKGSDWCRRVCTKDCYERPELRYVSRSPVDYDCLR